MKKIIFILIFIMIFTLKPVCAEVNSEQAPLNMRLMEYDDYQKISPTNIKSLKIIRYTE